MVGAMREVRSGAELTYVDPPAWRALRYALRSRISEHPAIYLPLARWRRGKTHPEVIGSETELVIDGYPRSANTFAVYTFQIAQPRPVRLAHHLHAPAHLIEAARRRIPSLVVIREPDGAVLSNVMFEEDATLATAFASYERFYRRLLPHARAMVAADFEDVTRDMGPVVARLNERFGTSYRALEPSEESRRRCFELMTFKERGIRVPDLRKLVLGFESGTVTAQELVEEGSALLPEPSEREGEWMPSADRSRTKEALRERWESPRLRRLRERAADAYRSFLEAAG